MARLTYLLTSRIRRLLPAATLPGLAVLVVACGTVNPPAEDTALQRPPNVIFILADDLGYAELGAYGNTFNHTPVLDTLAARGVRFTSAYAAAPVCSPYRAALLSGQHPARMGITDYLRPHGNEHLDEALTTLAESFRERGYRTGMVGKWHLAGYARNGGTPSPPQRHGFDEVLLSEQRGISGGSYFYPYHFQQEAAQRIFPTEYLTDRVNLEAADFVSRNRDQPFFLYKSHYSVHTNLNGPHALVEAYARQPGAGTSPEANRNNVHLAAQLETVDRGVGMLLDTLSRYGLLDNTVIVFTSDNGGETNVTSNAPLRAGKSTLYEGGIRIPLIMYWKDGRWTGGRTIGEATVNTDFFPTFRELLGLRAAGQVTDGRSLLPVLNDPEAERPGREIFWHYPLEAPHFLGGFSSGAVRSGAYKLIEDYTSHALELYDLDTDIGEKHNLAETQPAVRDSLYHRLREWRDRMGVTAQPHARTRAALPEYDPPAADPLLLVTNGTPVPYLNYGVQRAEDGSLLFDGRRHFLKLLPLYIPDVTAKGVTLAATVTPEAPDGVIVAHGEEVFGLALHLRAGRPVFSIRKYGRLHTLEGPAPAAATFRVEGTLTAAGRMSLLVDGKEVGHASIGEALPIPPDDPFSIGSDFRRLIGDYPQDNFFTGRISDFRFSVSP